VVFVGVGGGRGARRDAQLREDVLEMPSHGVLTDDELDCDLLVIDETSMVDTSLMFAVVKAVPILARTGSLLAHLAEEQQHPLGFVLAGRAEAAIEYEPRPDNRPR